jgi:hypothetical protein
MPLEKYKIKLLRMTTSNTDKCDTAPTRTEIFINQLLDSSVVGGIAGVSAFTAAGDAAGFKVFGIAFLITFLIKIKEYRKIQ